jgi:HAD superfamily hydrolase (TIGR01459 family)
MDEVPADAPETGSKIRPLTHFREVAGDFDLLFVDVWGVLHNGVAAHPAAGDALVRFREGGGFVALISNAPRPSMLVAGMLDRMGVPRAAYDAIVTSGDVSRALLADDPDVPTYHLGPARDTPIFAGLGLKLAGADEARRILCTGLFDDDVETVETYRQLLDAAVRRRVTMICANPDLLVERGARLIPCAGALAEYFEQRGGAVVWAGKPHRQIYERALELALAATDRRHDPARTLAIGDAFRTDIAGAIAMGVRSLLVADGIHAADLVRSEALDMAAVEKLGQATGKLPWAATHKLRW